MAIAPVGPWKHSKALPENLVILRYHYDKTRVLQSSSVGHVSLEILYNPQEDARGEAYRFEHSLCLNLYINDRGKAFYRGIVRLPSELYRDRAAFETHYRSIIADARVLRDLTGSGDDKIDYVIEDQKEFNLGFWGDCRRFNGYVSRKFIIGGLSLEGMLKKITETFPKEHDTDKADEIRPFALYQTEHEYGFFSCSRANKDHSCSSIVNEILTAGGFRRTHYYAWEPFVQNLISLMAGICLAVPFIRFRIEFGFDLDPDKLIASGVELLAKDPSQTADILRHAYWLAIACLIGAIISVLIRAMQAVTMGADIYVGHKLLGTKLIRPGTIMRKAAAMSLRTDDERYEIKNNYLLEGPVRVIELKGADERGVIAATFMRHGRVALDKIALPGRYICPLDPVSIQSFNPSTFRYLYATPSSSGVLPVIIPGGDGSAAGLDAVRAASASSVRLPLLFASSYQGGGAGAGTDAGR